MNRAICLIGNSHLAALQSALAADPGPPGIDWRFHPFVGDTTRALVQREGALWPMTDAARAQLRRATGLDHIALGQANAVVIVGLGVKSEQALHLRQRARWPGLPSLLTRPDLAEGPLLLSREAAVAGLAGFLATTMGFTLAAQVRHAVTVPVVMIGTPRLHAGVMTLDKGRRWSIPSAIGTGDAAGAMAVFAAAIARLAAQHGVTFVHQPAQTIVDHVLTDSAYMAATINVTLPRGRVEVRADFSHANARYGGLMVDRIIDALGPDWHGHVAA